MPTLNARSSAKRDSKPTRKRTPPKGIGATSHNTTDAIVMIDDMIGDDEELRWMIAEERVHGELARLIYDVRTKAGLTQKQLAEMIGTKQPVIARLEDADYNGHSLAMLGRIGRALNMDVSIRMTPRRKPRKIR